MNHHHCAAALPVELLSLAFDLLSLSELLTASHVSNYWRSVARRHPIFWRDITIASASPSALEFFSTRLAAGAVRTVMINIYIPPLEFIPGVRSLVFRTLTRNMYRIDRLHIEIPISADREMYCALKHPAPRLDTFDVTVIADAGTSDALPADLFACDAPRLRYVRITNTRLHADKIPRVFSSITQLNYCFKDTLSFPTALFAHCPLLDTLIIHGKHCTIDLADHELRTLPGDKLQFVDMSVFEGSSDLMHRLPCASIPEISIVLYDKLSAGILLGHLRGGIDLRLDLEPDGKHLFLHYQSVDSGMRRTFLAAPAQIAAAYLPPVYVADDLASRVQTLHATSTCAGLLPAFHALSACTRVSFSLVADGRLEPPTRPLCVPKLAHVDISSPSPRSLDAGEIAAFLDAAFAPGSDAVQVTMAGITLDGDLAKFPRDRFVLRESTSSCPT